MRATLTVVSVALCCVAGATGAHAQGAVTLGQPPARRVPLVSPRPELLAPLGTTKLEDLRVGTERGPGDRRPAPTLTAQDRASARLCPIPVARPDTTRLERMPVARSDTIGAASTPSVTIHGCENPLFR